MEYLIKQDVISKKAERAVVVLNTVLLKQLFSRRQLILVADKHDIVADKMYRKFIYYQFIVLIIKPLIQFSSR